MARVLILFAHPALERSRVHVRLTQRAREVPGITFHDLYEAYPTFDVDIEKEQALLTEHDVIVLQFPFFWYSTPALLKQWEDLVLEHGWAYGKTGTALRGKTLLCALSTGGMEGAYRENGYNKRTVRQFLSPIEQTAALCGMTYLAPFIVHGTHRLESPEIEKAAEDYHRTLIALRDGTLDTESARTGDRLNADQLPGGAR